MISGTVVRAGKIKLVETQREMKCGKCGHQWVIHGKVERDLGFPEILSCPSEEDCNSKNFVVVSASEVFKVRDCFKYLGLIGLNGKDYQEIKVQEQMQKLDFGSIPKSMHVILMDDLVDACKAGDDVTIGGIVTRRWRSFPREERPLVDIVFVANRVELLKVCFL